MDRDLIGYGAHPPDPKWPHGDPASVCGLTENGMLNPGVEGRDLATESMFAYGNRVAFRRIIGRPA